MYSVLSCLVYHHSFITSDTCFHLHSSTMKFTLVCVVFIVSTILLFQMSAATYRKPPFNGSIFGKRSTNTIEFDSNTGKTFASMCEIASQACNSWYASALDKKWIAIQEFRDGLVGMLRWGKWIRKRKWEYIWRTVHSAPLHWTRIIPYSTPSSILAETLQFKVW